MVTHGKQSNDSVIQTALKKIRFDIDLSDKSSIDKITLNIRNTVIRDLPSDIQTNIELQRVMLKSLLRTLLESKPTVFCKYIHIYIQSQTKADIYDVETFNTTFNTKACRLTKSNEASANTLSLPTNPVQPQTPIRNIKGQTQTHLQLTIEFIATSVKSNINHFVDSNTRRNVIIKINNMLFLAPARLQPLEESYWIKYL